LKNELSQEQQKLTAIKTDLDKKKSSAQGEYNNLNTKENQYENELENIYKTYNMKIWLTCYLFVEHHNNSKYIITYFGPTEIIAR
jgi:hypothetical protein